MQSKINEEERREEEKYEKKGSHLGSYAHHNLSPFNKIYDFSRSTDKQSIYTDWADKRTKGAGAEKTNVTRTVL